MRRLAPLLALAVLAPSPALAFSEFEAFGRPIFPPPPEPPDEPDPPGGGGGRYFTGAPADGFTCAVCHFGGAAPRGVELTIQPDPTVDGYRPRTEYRIELALPLDGLSAANVEVADFSGRAAGTLAAVPVGSQTAADRCVVGDAIASHEIEHEGRRIVGLDACGAIRLRTTWVAPETATGPVWLNVGTVWTNEANNEPTGDHTTVFARVIPPFGGTSSAGRVEGGCRAAPGSGGAPLALLIACGALARLYRRKLR
ncbi:MAG: hypothetical protein KF729_36050 [Sandaracinaceae bacterium]|nr:hypothetical protein [Sandaracinaceae bacterium]